MRPSLAQLYAMEKCYDQPMVCFFLDKIPLQQAYGEDFRRVDSRDDASVHQPAEDRVMTERLLRQFWVQHQILTSALAGDDYPKFKYLKSLSITANPEIAAHQVEKLLSFDRAAFNAHSRHEDAFKFLRTSMEALGIFVLIVKRLKGSTVKLSVEVFRGFVLADAQAPFIVINGNDAPRAQIFTLLHEFVHLCLGDTGISGLNSDNQREKFCNDVASLVLLPTSEFNQYKAEFANMTDNEEFFDLLNQTYQPLKISRQLLCYRLLRAKIIDRHRYHSLLDKIKADWKHSQSRTNEKLKKSKGDPNYYALQRYALGNHLLKAVKELHQSDELSTRKAAMVLGIKPSNLHNLYKAKDGLRLASQR